MVRGNTGKRGKRSVPRRGGSRRNNVARSISRIATREPYRVNCPQDPIPFRTGITITKYVHLRIIGLPMAGMVAKAYGSPVQPAQFSIPKNASANPVEVKVSMADIIQLIAGQWFSIPAATAPTLFEMLSVRKACVWSADSSTLGNSQVQLAIYPPKTVTDAIAPETMFPIPYFTDEGSPSTRARLSVATPVAAWFSGRSITGAAASDIVVIGNFGGSSTADSSFVGSMSILVSAISGYSQ